MNKSEFVEILAKKTKLSKGECDQFLNAFKDSILEVCSKGETLGLIKPSSNNSFGKFCLQEKGQRKYINPQTKRMFLSKPKKFVAFKGFKSFKYGVK